jgi:Pyridoxamine 5'-phosphate oxidase
MATWAEIEAAAPDLAARARASFDAHRHKLLATLRRDGSPRISGIETSFADGELWLGMMPGSRKALDLRRDPRLALHSASDDPPDDPTTWSGDAKLSGRAVEVDDPALVARFTGGEEAGGGEGDPAHLFRVDIAERSTPGSGTPPTTWSSSSGGRARACAGCAAARGLPGGGPVGRRRRRGPGPAGGAAAGPGASDGGRGCRGPRRRRCGRGRR